MVCLFIYKVIVIKTNDITSIETIYGLVDFAIMRGITKWYLHPQTGYYRY